MGMDTYLPLSIHINILEKIRYKYRKRSRILTVKLYFIL